ncbi:MAG: glycosyltransferase [Limisphaerales bacterium]
MRVLHVIPSLAPVHGGPSFALPLMANALNQLGVQVEVATTDDNGPGSRIPVPLEQPVLRDGWVIRYFARQTEFYKVSFPLCRWLRRHVREYDVVHIHALFSHTSVCAARAARRAGVPYIIRPLGVLNRWGREHRRPWLKALSLRFIEGPVLRGAAAMHYTSPAERDEAEEAGVKTRGVVIPLGLDLTQFEELPGPQVFISRFPQLAGKAVLLFLSRVDPKKGVDLLLSAVARLKGVHKDMMLVVAGDGEPGYLRRLQAQAAQLGVEDQVVWAGFLAGEEKRAALAAARAFVLPSHSENFGIAVVEALAAGLPVVTTPGVAIAGELRAHEAGMVVAPQPNAVAEALRSLLNDDVGRARLSANARLLAESRYSLEAMGKGLVQLYESVVRNPLVT